MHIFCYPVNRQKNGSENITLMKVVKVEIIS